MRIAKTDAKSAARKTAAKKTTPRAAAKAVARAAAKRVQAILTIADDGLFAVQSVFASGLLLILSAGYKIATQLYPPDI